MSALPRPLRWVALLAAVSLMSGCGESFGWYVVDPSNKSGWLNLKFLFSGYWYTIALTLTAMSISLLIGLLVALPSLSPFRVLRGVNRAYVDLVRSVPLLVLMLWVYHGLPILTGIQIGAFWSGVIALSLSDSAFEAEIFRAGIQSIDKGQHEAAQTIALGYGDKMRYVILPQAIKRILPAIGNQFIYMLKMSSLVSVIGVEELTRKANELSTVEYRPLEIYTVLIVEYMVLILIVSAGVRWLERRMGADER